jgi:tetratricopeptide (TPR) repeat protein
VHKSQGLTFNRVVIDFTGGAFSGGQTYVALSRCTSLEGITLTRPITSRDIFVNREVVRFSTLFNNKALIDKALQQAEADRRYHAAIEAFDHDDMELFLDEFFKAIHLRYDIEKPVIRRYIRSKLGIIRRLKQENARLRKANNERNEALRQYAYEYYLMGNECVVKARDYRAALANFDKALTLDPTLVDAWVRKGVTLADTNEGIAAMACFNEAIKLSPLNFKALYNRGKLRYESHEYEGAASDFAKAVAQKPQHATAHERLGDALMRLGLTDMAANHWAMAEDLRAKKGKK